MNTLSCEGLFNPRITWESHTYAYINVRFISGRNVVLRATEKDAVITWEAEEVIEKRQWFIWGEYISGGRDNGDCGTVGYLAGGGVFERDKNNPLVGTVEASTGIPFVRIELTPHPEYPYGGGNTSFYMGSVPKSYVDNQIIQGSTIRIIKVDECLPDGAIQTIGVRALSFTKKAIGRVPVSFWKFKASVSKGIFWNETTREFIGSSYVDNDVWNSNEGINPPSNWNIELVPQETRQQVRNYKKLQPNTGVRINESFDDNRRYLEEVKIDSGQVVYSFSLGVISGLGGINDNYNIECIKAECSPDNCQVDCGDKICCYGSDGIATEFFNK